MVALRFGKKWWPTAEEEKLLAENVESYRYRNVVEEAISRKYAWGEAPNWKERLLASEVHGEFRFSPVQLGALTPKMHKEIKHALERLWEESGVAKSFQGVLKVEDAGGVWVKVYNDGGKNGGWLLPPARRTSFSLETFAPDTFAEMEKAAGVEDGEAA